MTRVPGGSFTQLGKAVTIAPFCLDENEVTVFRYQQCIEKGACGAGPTTVQSPVMDAPDVKKWSALCNFGVKGREDHPMNCIDWHAARAFCMAGKGRLPREAEWEWAARGGDEARPYPWGELAPPAPNKKLMCWAKETGTLGTCPVSTHLDGVGRWRQADMSGNVREWTEDVFDDEAEKRVFRGGCFGIQEPAHAKTDVRAGMLPENRMHNVGFRCAASLAQ
jgi:formylglycine-generating enzyme required for sulfatase activity